MNVFVTGGAGYIGSVTSELLLDAGHSVTIFDNLERGHREAVDSRAEFQQGDLRDRDRIADALTEAKPDAVLHFAAYALVGESVEAPERYYLNNVTGGLNLAHAMGLAGVRRIVFSSTCATYGEPERMPITEDTPQHPTNPYGESKLAIEKAFSWYAKAGRLDPVFLRYFNACGATEKYGEDHDPETHLIPIVLQAALGRRQKVLIFGDDYDTPDGTCIRDYIHIVDLAHAHILALTSEESGAFNLGTGVGNSVKQVVDVAREVTGRDIPSETAPRRPGDPPRLVAAFDKAKRVLGWEPRCSGIREIMETAWRWHQAYPAGYGAGEDDGARE